MVRGRGNDGSGTAWPGFSEPLRQTLILAFYQGLKYHEVAALLRMPLGAVKSWRQAALVRMRDMARQGHLMEVG